MLFSDLIGIDVIIKNNTKTIGKLIDVDIYKNSSEIANIVFKLNKIYKKHLFSSSFEHKKNAKNTFIISDNKCILKYNNANTNFIRLSSLISKRVINNNGDELGIISNLVLSDDVSELKYLIISDGFYNDFIHGKLLCPVITPVITETDNEFVLISNESFEEIGLE